MSDEVDEWAHAMRCELDRAMAEGRTTITLTAPVKGLSTVIDIAHAYFRDTSRTCLLCGAIRRSNELAVMLKQLESNPNWRRDLRGPRR